MDSRRLMVVVLVALLVAGLALSIAEAWRSGDWLGAVFSLGPELVGAVVTYLLFDQFIERRERTEAEKARLIAEMGSSVNDVAKAAADKLRQHGWLFDGSLQGARLIGADLQGADLSHADLQEARLIGADLQGADLLNANLQGADLQVAILRKAMLVGANLRDTRLSGANLQRARLGAAKLQGADLSSAKLRGAFLEVNATEMIWVRPSRLAMTFEESIKQQAANLDENTRLPDGTMWTPDANVVESMARFTDPDHPEFWQPEWARERDP